MPYLFDTREKERVEAMARDVAAEAAVEARIEDLSSESESESEASESESHSESEVDSTESESSDASAPAAAPRRFGCYGLLASTGARRRGTRDLLFGLVCHYRAGR